MERSDIDILRPKIFGKFQGIVAGMSTRLGGDENSLFGFNLSFSVGDQIENVEKNRELFFKALGISADLVAFSGQIHSSTVQSVKNPGRVPDVDALLTNEQGLFLAITVADCVPILLFDPILRVASAVHAGWRGSLERIVSKTVLMMKEQYGTSPEDVHAFIGPSAGRCCYEVGNDVAEMFQQQYVEREDNGRYLLDLKGMNADMLRECGLMEEKIDAEPECTICNPLRYHSYRRDGKLSGRMLAVIGMKK